MSSDSREGAKVRRVPFAVCGDGRGRWGIWDTDRQELIISKVWSKTQSEDILAYLTQGYLRAFAPSREIKS